MVSVASDLELVHAAQAGDVAAFGALLERQRAPLSASALAILGDRAQAQDIVHDAFLTALRRLRDLRDPATVSAWLHAIVRNACRMHLRARRELPGDLIVLAGADRLDIEEELEQIALRDWVWTAIAELPDDLRATVMLRFFARRASYAEIAATLGIPIGTVRSRLNQAKRKLAASLIATSTASHNDHAALVEQRWTWGNAAVDEIEREGRATLYVENCLSDVLIEVHALGYRTRGVQERWHDVVEAASAGVRVHLTGIAASADVTILEADFENPPDDP